MKEFKETINIMNIKINDLAVELKNLTSARESLRSVCRHENEKGESVIIEVGRDSHKKYYKCEYCGYTDQY